MPSQIPLTEEDDEKKTKNETKDIFNNNEIVTVTSTGTSSCSTTSAITNNESTLLLLHIICTAIARDGGASLVTSIKDYLLPKYSKKRLHTLLIHAIGKPKLLTFLETFSSIFHVKRNETPHWVVLISYKYVQKISSDLDKKKIQTYQQQLYTKAIYVLRKRRSKLDRRRRGQQQQQQQSTTDNNNTNGQRKDNEKQQQQIEQKLVNTFWLLRQCMWDFHSYLRVSKIYLRLYKSPQDVQRVGSLEWESLVLQEFESVLYQYSNHQQPDTEEDKQLYQQEKVIIQNGKVCLALCNKSNYNNYMEEKEEKRYSNQTIGCAKNNSMSNNNNNDDDENNNNIKSNNFQENDDISKEFYDLDYLYQLDQTITEIVNKDGGHQVKLELLLHRHSILKSLLGGRDLLKLIRYCRHRHYNHKSLFQNIEIYQKDSDIILRSKQQQEQIEEQFDSNDDDYNQGRLKADVEGLYSVTNSKYGTAMANIMVHCCRKSLLNGYNNNNNNRTNNSNEDDSNDDISIIAIDLTASIGGMTLGLCKTNYFRKVIAVEIDTKRSTLCQQNMIKHGMDRIVDVRNMDAMDIIPTLSNNNHDSHNSNSCTSYDNNYYCIVIDPPWGGMNYKQRSYKEEPLTMGDWLLEDIFERISIHVRPCVVGLRVPINFVVEDLLDTMRKERNLVFETLEIRKLSVQLFVVVYFPSRERIKTI